jgi:hypothetical protein
MDAMMIVAGLIVTGLGGYVAIWPEAAARRDNAGRAADPEPTPRFESSRSNRRPSGPVTRTTVWAD